MRRPTGTRRRATDAEMRCLGTARALWLVLFWSFILTSGTYAYAAETVTLALVVGSGAYHGQGELQPLEHADSDVVRFARALQPFVPFSGLYVLFEPDDQAAAEARALGIGRWSPPTRAGFLSVLSLIEDQTRQLRANKPGTQVRVVVYVSAHGDSHGVHLSDGILTGGALQAGLRLLSADAVMLVADSCFSDYWLGLKGDAASSQTSAPISFPLDAVAAAVRDLEQVGAVTAQSYTREERSLIQGGLLTHVVSSALLGPADIDQDGLIRYDELRAYLETYGRQAGALDRVKVHAPSRASVWPPVVVSLRELPARGLMFPSGPGKALECYWIRDEAGRLRGEFCRHPREARRLYLASGRYRLLKRSPPDQGWGPEGVLEVREGFTRVDPATLDKYWVSSLIKGTGEGMAPPDGARALSEEESGYLARTPVKAVVPWRRLEGQLQPFARLRARLPLASPEGEASLETSLTQEQPVAALALGLDWRMARLGRGFLSLGLEVGGGLSQENQVGAASSVSVCELFSLMRLGVERPAGRWSGRVSLFQGGLSAAPCGQAAAQPTSAGGSPAEDYRLPFTASGGLELGISYRLRPDWGLEAGLAPQWTVERQDLGDPAGPRLVPYLGLSGFLGCRW